MRLRRAIRLFVLGGLCLGGCVVQSTWLRPDYDTADRLTLKRLVVLVETPKGTLPAVDELAGRLARRYVNQKRDFIVLRNATTEARGGPPRSEALAGAEGVLSLRYPELTLAGDELAATLEAQLERADGTPVWRAVGALSEEQSNEDLTRLQARYARELGPEVDPFTAPLFILTKRVFDTLPSPQLTDDDILEKIELEE